MLKQEYYLTKEGLQAFQNELQHLISVRRKEVADHIGAAADYGDLRENSEYDAAMEEQVFLERRIAELDRILRFAVIIKPHTGNEIVVGSYVVVRKGNEILEFVIVDSHESDPLNRKISHRSPIGSALLGKRVGDSVMVAVPDGNIGLVIVSIGILH